MRQRNNPAQRTSGRKALAWERPLARQVVESYGVRPLELITLRYQWQGCGVDIFAAYDGNRGAGRTRRLHIAFSVMRKLRITCE